MALVQVAEPEMNLHRKTMVAGEPAVKMRVVPGKMGVVVSISLIKYPQKSPPKEQHRP